MPLAMEVRRIEVEWPATGGDVGLEAGENVERWKCAVGTGGRNGIEFGHILVIEAGASPVECSRIASPKLGPYEDSAAPDSIN